jgi:hypothetical protein
MLRFMALEALQPPPDAGLGEDVIAVLAGDEPPSLLCLLPVRLAGGAERGTPSARPGREPICGIRESCHLLGAVWWPAA